MKDMQILKELGPAELDSKLKDLKKEQFALRAQKSTGSLEKPASLGVLRKQIARVLTLMRERNPKVKKSKSSKQIKGGDK